MNTLRNNSLLASAQSIFVRFFVAFALGLAMASIATMSAQAADYQWFGPTDPANGSGSLSTTSTAYTSNFGVAFKTGASGPYRMQWVKLNLTSSSASSNITVKLSLRDTTDSTAYSAAAGTNEYAVDTLNITTPTTANTPFTLNLDPTTIPNIAAYTMSADTSYALILYGASANLAIRRTGVSNVYLPNTTNNYYTLNDGFTVLNTFRNNATYSANSTNYPSLHFFFGTWQVTYDANNATSGTAPSSQPKYAGVDLTLAANSGTLARTGYTFAGWNTAAIGDGTDYAAGATYSVEASPTLYAKWAAANAIPTVTAISPTSGSTLGGTAVTITGADLTAASAVTIGGAACTSVNPVSATSITCTTPIGAAGTASVLVTTSGGTNTANTLYTYVTPAPAPTVTAISPTSGSTLGGSAVTITGTDLTGASAVTLGGAACTSVNPVSATSITCTTPTGAAGTASVLVTTSGGTNTANTLYTYVTPAPAPTVTAISPTSGSTLGGTAVTITGADLTGASAVTLGGAACTSVNASATSITCSTSALAAGIASVLVTTSGGTNVVNTLFTYTNPNVIVKLNDSGVTQCTNDGSTTLVPCSAANTGNAGTYPRQDARFGRDAAQAAGKLLPAKIGGGAAGFDFTPLDASGNAIALTGSPSTHACVHDNVTNLTWEVKTTSGLRSNTNTYTWYNGRTGDLGTDTCGGTLGGVYADQCNINNYALAVNAAGLCGNHNPWRVPGLPHSPIIME
jgi:uncharacterized repeat protein (TIGR02543 family)